MACGRLPAPEASGVLIVGLPILVLDRLHANAAFGGLLWALSALSGVLAGVVAGRYVLKSGSGDSWSRAVPS